MFYGYFELYYYPTLYKFTISNRYFELFHNYSAIFGKRETVKPWPWGIKGQNVSILSSISPVVKSFAPLTSVYIAQLLINWRPYWWGWTGNSRFLMSGFKTVHQSTDQYNMVRKHHLFDKNKECWWTAKLFSNLKQLGNKKVIFWFL